MRFVNYVNLGKKYPSTVKAFRDAWERLAFPPPAKSPATAATPNDVAVAIWP
jgi:hypothetical protein